MTDTENSPPKNQQFSLLNTFRRERTLLDVYLVSGIRLRGRIRSFDQYSMMLDTGQSEAFLYHHAVSSIGPAQTKAGFKRATSHAQTQAADDEMPERRAPPPPKPATEVTVVRRVSRKVQIPGNESR